MDIVAYTSLETKPDNIVVRWGKVALTAKGGVAINNNNGSWSYISETTLEQCRQAPWE